MDRALVGYSPWSLKELDRLSNFTFTFYVTGRLRWKSGLDIRKREIQRIWYHFSPGFQFLSQYLHRKVVRPWNLWWRLWVDNPEKLKTAYSTEPLTSWAVTSTYSARGEQSPLFGNTANILPAADSSQIAACLPKYFFPHHLLSVYHKTQDEGLPSWLRLQRIYLQCRRPGLDPWVRKIPWRR